MTVAQLIAKLQKVPDQSMTVEIELENDDWHLEYHSINSVTCRGPRYSMDQPTILISNELGKLW